MRLGLWAPRGGQSDEDSIDDVYRFSIEVVQKAEDLGFVTALVAQRYIGLDLDAWVLGSALVPHTKSIELLLAIHPGILTPQLTAKMGSTLDCISGGRFAINLVNGWWQEEMENYGNGAWLDRSDARYRRMGEFVTVLKGLWTEESFTHKGEFFTVREGRLPLKPIQKLPPIYTASRSEIGQEIIARQCEQWFISYEAGYENYESNLRLVADEAARMSERAARFGRRIGYGVSANVVCAATRREAEAIADRIEGRGTDKKVGGTAVTALGVGLVGTPEMIAERMHAYQEIGVETFMLRFPNMLPGLDQFGREVVPLLGDSIAGKVAATATA